MKKYCCDKEEVKIADVMTLKYIISFLFWKTVSYKYDVYRSLFSRNEGRDIEKLHRCIFLKVTETVLYKRFKACDISMLDIVVNRLISDEYDKYCLISNTRSKDVQNLLNVAAFNKSKLENNTGGTIEIISRDNMMGIKKTLLEMTEKINRLKMVKEVNEISLELGVDIS